MVTNVEYDIIQDEFLYSICNFLCKVRIIKKIFTIKYNILRNCDVINKMLELF